MNRTLAYLADGLSQAKFDYDAVVERLGDAAVAALGRNTSLAALDALGTADDAQATVIRLWLLQRGLPRPLVETALGDLAALTRAGLLASGPDDTIRAAIEIRPYGTDSGLSGWVCSDLTPGLDGQSARPRPDFVLGVSPASTTLSQLTLPGRVGTALDLGTGSGVQSLHLTRQADRVVATDLNPRAVWMAGVTATVNGVSVDVREGSLFEPVAGESFDLIVSNPPYVMSPPGHERLVYREGELAGDALVQRIVEQGAGHLNPGGSLQVLGNWASTREQPWEERVHRWIERTGCDALVVQRESLDAYEYIELWLGDAGLVGSPEYPVRYREWLDYFDHLGIVEVGLGWLCLTRAGRTSPNVRIETLQHAVQQPVGHAFADHIAHVAAAELPDESVLAQRWVTAGDLAQETIGDPGAADPRHIVLRQASGFRRAAEVDTALAAVVGACDGDYPLADLLHGVAVLLDLEPSALADAQLPRLRQLIEEGFLRRADHVR